MERNAFFQTSGVTPYNPLLKKPVLRTRIANGERMAGFVDLRTGKFEEAMLISNEADLKEFMRRYQIKSKDEIQDGL
ncbi:MAG: aspartate dehydrogenase [Lachnospiraceae bacterium]|nr:aspartate dehydrogenase [Lachnospiraceae bacterium]